MELKVVCNCGQKYKFDVEPAYGRMPFAVQCPVCGTDGTPLANALLAQSLPKPAVPVVAAPPRISVAQPAMAVAPAPALVVAPAPAMAVAAAPAAMTPPPIAAPMKPQALAGVLTRPKSPGEFNMGLGLLGAFLGAAVGAGIMYGFFALTDFKFPFMGAGIGALSGLGARILYKGKASTLGGITAGIALAATAGTLYYMYGDISGSSVISMLVSAYVAYRIAA